MRGLRTYTMWLLLLAAFLTMLLTARAATVIIPRSTSWRYHAGTEEASDPRSAWRLEDFDDSGWSSGNLPIGYGVSGLGTTLSDMQGNYSTVFLRRTFTMSSVPADLRLRALVDRDDGYIMWINGERVLDKDEPDGTPLHTSLASDYHSYGEFQTEALSDVSEYLEVGQNVIAVQLFNKTLGSGDCAIDVELESFKRVADTKFSHDRGFYDAPFTLTISTATVGATIRYTTDGSKPTATHGSTAVTQATIPVSATLCVRAAAFYQTDYEATDVDTHTYIFLDSVLDQPAEPAGFPSYWKSENDGDIFLADYEMDPEIVDDPQYQSNMKDYMRSIPTISIVTDVADMFGTEGFYRNGGGSGDLNELWEKAVSAEFLYPSGKEGFQIDCGIRPRSWLHKKRSFTLGFKAIYGPTKLRYPVFEGAAQNADSATDTFDRLILRAGANDSWQGTDAENDTYTRDPFERQSAIAMSGLGVHGTFVHLYMNGLYWGQYNLTERPDASFTSEYLGGEKEDWYAGNHGHDSHAAISGDDTRFMAMIDQANQDLSNTANYNTMKGLLDLDQYIDHCMVRWYTGMGDWVEGREPTGYKYVNNYYVGNSTVPPGPVKYFSWDGETAWEVIDDPLDGGYKCRANDGAWIKPQFFNAHYVDDRHKWVARPMRALVKNLDFRTLFADRLYKHCYNDGALAEANAKARWNAINASVADAMVCESARWGDLVRDRVDGSEPVYTRHDHWYAACTRIENLMTGNADQLRTVCRTEDINGQFLYTLLDPPGFHQHGGAIGAGFTLTLTNPNGEGTLVYKTDGTDPRKWDGTGGQASGASVYGSPIALSRTTHIKARVRKTNGTWSAVRAATYNYTAHYPLLKITEIMYNPLGGGDFEFIEIKNTSGSTTVGLSEMTFSGLRYVFPEGAELTPGKFAVLVRNEQTFTNRYPSVKGSPDVEVFGVFAGGLDNSGERIRLKDCDGETVTTVRYNDKAPWPEEADGDGYSLCFEGAGDQDNPLKWRRSNLIGGTPGYDEDPLYDVVINEALTHTDLPQVDAVELYNAGAGSVNIGGWYLSDTVADYKKYQIPSTTLNAGAYVVFDETDFGTWALDSHGDEVYLTHWDGNGNLLYLAEESFGGAANGVAFGRHVRTDRELDFVAQSVSNTLGGANAYPLVGPVVINEVMYHPLDPAGLEYVELYNVSDSAVNLYDPAAPTNGWMLDGAVEYTFSSGDTIAAGEYVLVVPTNETAFRAVYPGVPGGVQVFGPYAGRLDNGGESVKLWRPDTPDPEGVPRILVDRVKYDDDSLWIESPDGRGPSLERVASSLYGNDPANWSASLAADGTPGEVNSGVLVGKTAAWRYHDQGENLGTGWRLAAYDDYGWDDGNAPLGYPDTNPALDTEVDFGDDPSGKYTTTYFRTRFMLDTDPSNVDSLTLRVRYDDGYVAYLNGQEVARGGMPTGGITHYTLANVSNGSGGAYEEKNLASHITKLVTGVNVLAVEVHQVSAGSSDLFMDLELVHTVAQQTPCALPAFSPPDGTEFSGSSLNVTVSTATSGATVFYTTDGSDPTDTDNDGSGVNSVVVNLTASRTIKARAYHETGGYAPSAIAVASYTRLLPTVATPTIDPAGGDFYGSVNVTVSTTTSGATVFYTTDGSTPSDSNHVGFGTDSVQFSLTQDRTVKARAYKLDYNESAVATAAFNEDTPTIGFATAATNGSESATSPSLTVALSGSTPQTVRVDYARTGGTATSGSDFTLSSGVLTFNAGQTSKQIPFSVVDDLDIEGNETIVVTLSNAQNANAGQMTTTYTITDNDQLFVAYNDLCWVSGQTTQNITTYTKGQGGLLADYATGDATPVNLTVIGGSGPYTNQGVAPDGGTDAYSVFYDSGRGDWKSDPAGLISYGSNLTLSISGLDAGLLYEFVLFGNRGVAGYEGRTTIVTLTGVEPGFQNTSSAGTDISTTTLANDTTEVVNGNNTANGHVARYTKIDAGSDGAFTVTVKDSTTQFYANILMLRALEPTTSVSVVSRGASWKYRDTGENLGTAWRAPGYDDAAWSSGPAGLGYPETKTNVVTTVSYGPDPNNKYVTTYYRTYFTLDVTPARVAGLRLYAFYDDGFVAYLNGQEIARGGMPTGPITYATLANVQNGSAGLWEETDCGAYISNLVEGQNVLAVELHQVGVTSSDTVMSMELVADVPGAQDTVVHIAKGAAWRWRPGTAEASDPVTDWRTVGFDDAAWASSNAPFGYGSGSYATTLAMEDNYASLFLRKAFTVDAPGLVGQMTLNVDYDDGFIAWLNGEEIARVNVQDGPGTFIAHDQTCSGYVSGTGAAYSDIFQGGRLPELGTQNVLAVQLFNNTLSSGDALIDVELSTLEGSDVEAGDDLDLDGMPDDWENEQLGTTGHTVTNDTDLDGLTDLFEFIAGTVATNAASSFKVQVAGGANVTVSFEARQATGTGYSGFERHYCLQQRVKMDPNDVWSAVPGYSNIVGQGQTVVYTNAAPPGGMLYRGRVWLE